MNRRVVRWAGRAANTALGACAGLILLGWVLGVPVWVHPPEVTAAVRCELDDPRTTPPVQAPECGAPVTLVSVSADQPAVNPLLSPAAGPTSEAVAGPTSPSDTPWNGVRLLPWLAGAALVGAIVRVLQNLVRRRSRRPVVTR